MKALLVKIFGKEMSPFEWALTIVIVIFILVLLSKL
jgi:hypothetical protein